MTCRTLPGGTGGTNRQRSATPEVNCRGQKRQKESASPNTPSISRGEAGGDQLIRWRKHQAIKRMEKAAKFSQWEKKLPIERDCDIPFTKGKKKGKVGLYRKRKRNLNPTWKKNKRTVVRRKEQLFDAGSEKSGVGKARRKKYNSPPGGRENTAVETWGENTRSCFSIKKGGCNQFKQGGGVFALPQGEGLASGFAKKTKPIVYSPKERRDLKQRRGKKGGEGGTRSRKKEKRNLRFRPKRRQCFTNRKKHGNRSRKE